MRSLVSGVFLEADQASGHRKKAALVREAARMTAEMLRAHSSSMFAAAPQENPNLQLLDMLDTVPFHRIPPPLRFDHVMVPRPPHS